VLQLLSLPFYLRFTVYGFLFVVTVNEII